VSGRSEVRREREPGEAQSPRIYATISAISPSLSRPPYGGIDVLIPIDGPPAFIAVKIVAADIIPIHEQSAKLCDGKSARSDAPPPRVRPPEPWQPAHMAAYLARIGAGVCARALTGTSAARATHRSRKGSRDK